VHAQFPEWRRPAGSDDALTATNNVDLSPRSLSRPRSVALVGASPREKSVGRAILNNLRAGGWTGPLHLVNPKHDTIDGMPAIKDLSDLSSAPDLVIVTVPAAAVPYVVTQSADMGVAAAIVITAGLGHGPGSLAQTCEQAARAKGLRIVGPNCLGVLAPSANLNASFAASMPRAGELALISQSGAIAAGMVDWAAQRHVGFSAMVSIGDQLDVDFGDLLDHFALDRATRAILLYVESIKDARKFMSAARAAARVKPVIVVKAGRQAAGAKAAATHTGALAGSDAVYAAAFHRAGLLRVLDLGELFDAAETLARVRYLNGNRLAILTNGGGIGVLAADRLADLNGRSRSFRRPRAMNSTACCPRPGRNRIRSTSSATPTRPATWLRWRCSWLRQRSTLPW
jgi:acetyltransferase